MSEVVKNITKGDWKIHSRGNLNVVGDDNRMVATTGVYQTNSDNGEYVIENEANAIFIADAGTTANKCGLLPSELLSELEYWIKRCELIEACENASPCDPYINNEQIEAWKNYHAFIKEFGNRTIINTHLNEAI